MSNDEDYTGDVQTFWNSRAGLGQWAGTRDVIAKHLEIEAIATYVRDGMRILEVGCGNGITAIELARRYQVDVIGVDFAQEMITAATGLASRQDLKGSVRFQISDIRDPLSFTDKFDLVYSERVLINLPDWPSQRQAILSIRDVLCDGGCYVMCENSQDGLDQINLLRTRVGLTSIAAPWHNHYLVDADIEQASFPGLSLEEINFYSSTYYFLSRVVNAWLALQDGKEPDYNAPVNGLALQLPSIGKIGQGRIWLWRRSGQG